MIRSKLQKVQRLLQHLSIATSAIWQLFAQKLNWSKLKDRQTSGYCSIVGLDAFYMNETQIKSICNQ